MDRSEKRFIGVVVVLTVVWFCITFFGMLYDLEPLSLRFVVTIVIMAVQMVVCTLASAFLDWFLR